MSLEAMGLPAGASEDDLKARYRQLAMQLHPDRGGTTARFQELQDWYKAARSEVGRTAVPTARSFFRPMCMHCMGHGQVLVGPGMFKMNFVCEHCGGSGYT